ncbi:MAG: carboxypeptidase regulatory-like domain-containing protein [Vicinamibacterales bacterium]
MRRVLVGSVLALLFTLAAPLYAQQGTAQIAGKITDEQGSVLPGVSIVVTNEDTGVFREVASSSEGTFFASQLVPGRYKLAARITGFQALERSGIVVSVGNTATINLTLKVGGLEETVTVTGQTPLVDTTSVRVGGNIGTAELSELPAMNRNYFAAVALLPGVQFSPSNQMGNDTIVASGQSTQGNNVAVDGGYNGDDALGTSSGAQVRTPLEAIQEFQVVTSMYDAEYGRASGAIVNAVTKAGTNQFRGVVFGYAASNSLTAEDYFVKTRNLAKPTTKKREWGGVLGGPIIKNKMHFFFSLERQLDNPNRTRTFTSRPDLDFAIAEDRTDWNTVVRFDHQVNANHTWAVRWLRETAPQWNTVGTRQTLNSLQDETDLDQTLVGTLTSVVGNARVNTFRVARTWEHWWHGNACWRAQGEEGSGYTVTNQQSLCPPQLDQLSFLGQASTESQGPWDSNYQVEDDLSWFLPGKKGDHDVKVGARYNYTELRRVSQINQNGTFRFNTDLPFDAADPRTYPERFTVRQGQFNEYIKNHTYEFFAQDKWTVGRTTMSLGLRYDLEIIPLDESTNPLFPAGTKDYPIDKNNVSPRIGITHSLDDQGKSVIRAGYGIFYNRTILGALDDTMEFGKFTSSVNLTFPNNSADPGPSAGRLPTDPFLVNGPYVNRALLDQLYPPGVPLRNTGDVIYDAPDRGTPYAHQMMVGYVRQLASSLAVHADFVRVSNRDMFLARNLNPMQRANTTRTGAITRSDAFGLLGEPYSQHVWLMENTGTSDYNALNLSLEKRYSNNWSARVSYSLSKSEGTANNQADKNTYQVGTNLNLDQWSGPSDVDRRHILSIGARTEVPRTGGLTLSTTVRYMSGAPFTLYDSSIDTDQNGELVDPLPAGTYSGTDPNALKNVDYAGGRNGAIGPDYFQIDLRAGWQRRVSGDKTVELFFDIFNITNRANFDNPTPASSDRRTAGTFLALTNLRGGGGFPRQAQMGLRFAF